MWSIFGLVMNAELGGDVDLVHLDGALSLYPLVLGMLEPRLSANTLAVAENATPDYREYVSAPGLGYLSLTLPFDDSRGNELSVFTG